MSSKDSAPGGSASDATSAGRLSIPRELIDALPEEKRKELLEKFEQEIVHVRSEEYYSGPDIHPEIAARWEDILQGSAKELFEISMQHQIHRMTSQDGILTIAEGLSNHRIKLETQSQKDSAALDRSIVATIASRERKGQWFAFLAVLVITFGGFYMVHLGHGGLGLGVLVFEAAGVAAVFLYQVRANRANLSQTNVQTE